MKNIRGSVGRGGRNRFDDVRTVQYLLNCVPRSAGGPWRELRVDGVAGELTLRAVGRFLQRCGGGGRFTPRGAALRELWTFDPYPKMRMPEPPMSSETAKKQQAVRRASTVSLAAESIARAVAYAAAKLSGMGLRDWAALESVAGAARAAAATCLPEPVGDDFTGTVRMALAEARRAGEERARQWGLRIPGAGLDVVAALGLAPGEAGLWHLAAHLADTAHDGVERPGWPGAPGADDALWRQWSGWWEMRKGAV